MFPLVLLLSTNIAAISSARILAIMPSPSYSHQVVFNPLWLALNAQGHDITLLTTDPIQTSNLSRFRQIDWHFTYHLWHEKHNASYIIKQFRSNLFTCMNRYVEMMKDIFSQELSHPEVQQIINGEEKFDLVIAEVLIPVMAAFAKRFNCPFIGVSPMDTTMFYHEGQYNPTSPALYPDLIAPFDSEMSFTERGFNTFLYLLGKVYFRYYLYPRMDEIVGQYFGPEVPRLEELQKEASLVFLNINPVLHNIRPLASNVVIIGGGMHLQSATSLPDEIKTFLDSATKGAIYFSLGTNVKSKDLPEETKKILVEVFDELSYKVIWKFEDSNFEVGKHSNILMRRWLPQQQILKHPNVKLFITQGGLQSLEEAIFSAVPVIAVPAYVDQYSNVRKVVRKGMGLTFDLESWDKDALKAIIEEVITNTKYKEAMKKQSVLLKDQPISGVNQTLWWVEYVLKHKGARFLKNRNMPMHQYFLVDVMALLITILFVLICLVVIIWRKMRRSKRSKYLKLD